MIFPIGDDQVKGGSFPIFSYLFIAFNIGAFIFELTLSEAQLHAFVLEFGIIPAEITSGKEYADLLTSMFLHGGWMHLIGNMLFLWVFGDNIEAIVGNVQYVLFYMLGGLAASAAHIFFHPADVVPTIGASGAISAILGAYLVMFPRSQIKVLVIYLFSSFRMAAIYFLGLWIVQQLFSGIAALSGVGGQVTGGVAWWAHIGGFAFGVLAGLYFKNRYSIEQRTDIIPHNNKFNLYE